MTNTRRANRPYVTNTELLAMSRMLRLHLHDDRFFNPIDAHETRKLALRGMAKVEGWRHLAAADPQPLTSTGEQKS